MKNKQAGGFFAVFILLFIGGHTVFAQNSQPKMPRVFLLNARILQEHKAKLSDVGLKSALARLEKDPQKTLKTEVASIITKESNPPSGDRHDNKSQAP